MTDSLLVAAAQFAPTADSAANLAEMTELATRAAERGAGLVVFPEYSSYFEAELGPRFVENAQSIDGPFVEGLAALAKLLGIHVVAGLVESTGTDRFSNTLVALSPAGDLVATYRKLHLYDAFGSTESDWVVPGTIEAPETFEVGGFAAGLQTCYDVRFPEVTRTLVDAGAELVLLPAEWVRGPLKENHWRTLVTARALENTVFVVAADHTPPVGVGTSMVVDPHGVVLAQLGDEKGLAIAEITRERLDSVRLVNPALALRRFSVSPRATARLV